MRFKIDINSDEVVKHTLRLEKIQKELLPKAIANTLNKGAFEVKKSIPTKADQTFEKRSPNFFKATSRVTMAEKSDISTMAATVGFNPDQSNANKHAVQDLEQQEHGGNIGGRTFVPTRFARAGNKANKNIRTNARLSEIKKSKIVSVRHVSGKNDREKFIKSVAHAGKGGYVLSKTFLWKINSIKRKGGNLISNKTPLYSFQKNRNVKISGTGFMRDVSEKVAKKLPDFYKNEIDYQLRKLKR